MAILFVKRILYFIIVEITREQVLGWKTPQKRILSNQYYGKEKIIINNTMMFVV